MRNTIYRYFFKEFISLFALILLSLSIIVWVVQAVNYLDFVTEDGHSFKVYFAYSMLNIPKVVGRLIPLVFLISLSMSIVQLEKNNELLAFWTSGVNKINFVNFAIKIAILITLIQFFLSLFASNLSLNFGRSILKKSDITLLPSLLKEKKFNDTVENLTVFIEEKKNNGEMINIFLRDDRSRIDQNKTIIAKSGYIIKKNDQNILVLFNGTIQTKKKNGKINFLNFNKTEINLSLFSTKTITTPKIQEINTLSLLNCIKPFLKENEASLEESQCQGRLEDIKSEINRRIGMPLYIPFISIIVCYLLYSKREKNSFSIFQKYIVFAVSFIILVLAEITVRYSGLSTFNSIIYYSLPPVFILINYLNLIRIFKFESLK